nr:hypothetical protein [Tanacetum cinerariifolium]
YSALNNDFIALCFKHGWKDAISSGIRILVLTSASSSYYLRGRIQMHSPSGAEEVVAISTVL